ncbi:MAG: cellulose-binding protein [Actinomycetales bacterium]|nr:cellulose-binding protein [Actinomycetales bacterium]
MHAFTRGRTTRRQCRGTTGGKHRRATTVLVVLGTTIAVTWPLAPASALDTSGTPSPVTGNATWFSGIGGTAYGGCGLPQSELDTQDFIALNVYNTPGDYVYYPRPLTGTNLAKVGMWNNGHNCGRWVRVTVGDYCTGVNDGAAGQAFCRNGSWVADENNGATLNMIVADSCGDDNAWCREDPYHIDLARPSLARFVKNGATVPDLYPDHWNNRHMTWEFIEAPDYSGDITIGFLQGAQTWWGAIAISHLPNGIHGIESYVDGAWVPAEMDGDMGQAFIAKPKMAGGSDFSIRVIDAADEYLNDGRVYSFSLPEACSERCLPMYTQVDYTTSTSPTSTATGTGPGTGTATTTTTSGPGRTCTATYRTVNSWPDGLQGEITVQAGTSALSGWTVSWDLADGQSLKESWNATVTSSGSTITARGLSWNGTVKAGSTATFGFVLNGAAASPALTCTSP